MCEGSSSDFSLNDFLRLFKVTGIYCNEKKAYLKELFNREDSELTNRKQMMNNISGTFTGRPDTISAKWRSINK